MHEEKERKKGVNVFSSLFCRVRFHSRVFCEPKERSAVAKICQLRLCDTVAEMRARFSAGCPFMCAEKSPAFIAGTPGCRDPRILNCRLFKVIGSSAGDIQLLCVCVCVCVCVFKALCVVFLSVCVLSFMCAFIYIYCTSVCVCARLGMCVCVMPCAHLGSHVLISLVHVCVCVCVCPG